MRPTPTPNPDTAKIISEHRADPGAAVRGLTQLFLCAASLAVPIADHTGHPGWSVLVGEIEAMLVRLDRMDAEASEQMAPAVRRRSAA